MTRLRSRMLDLATAQNLALELRNTAHLFNGSGALLLSAAEMIDGLTEESRSLRYHGVTGLLVNTVYRRVLSQIVREAIESTKGQDLIRGYRSVTSVKNDPLFQIGLVTADTNYLRFWNNVFMSHETGNDVLRLNAQVLEQMVESQTGDQFFEGLTFHIGGDEFTVILDGCPIGNEKTAMSVAYYFLDELDGIEGVELPISASFGCSHLLDSVSLFVKLCNHRPDLFPVKIRDTNTILMQIMEWMADTRGYLAKTAYRFLLLRELAQTYRDNAPETYNRYWGFLHEGTYITTEELENVIELNDHEADYEAQVLAVGHVKKIIAEMYTGYERIGRHDFERQLIEIMVKEYVCGLSITLPEKGKSPYPRGFITF